MHSPPASDTQPAERPPARRLPTDSPTRRSTCRRPAALPPHRFTGPLPRGLLPRRPEPDFDPHPHPHPSPSSSSGPAARPPPQPPGPLSCKACCRVTIARQQVSQYAPSRPHAPRTITNHATLARRHAARATTHHHAPPCATTRHASAVTHPQSRIRSHASMVTYLTPTTRPPTHLTLHFTPRPYAYSTHADAGDRERPAPPVHRRSYVAHRETAWQRRLPTLDLHVGRVDG